jgi:hypothetical protein
VIAAQSRHLQRNVSSGSFSVLHRKRKLLNGTDSQNDEAEDEYLLGTVAFMPNKKQRKDFRIQIAIQQNVFANGFMGSVRPTLSFSAIHPKISAIFEAALKGNVEWLMDILSKGEGSLSDCSEDGHSLFVVNIVSAYFLVQRN